MSQITGLRGLEILDSRGNPTVASKSPLPVVPRVMPQPRRARPPVRMKPSNCATAMPRVTAAKAFAPPLAM